MKQLIQGLQQFVKTVHSVEAKLFETLSKGQDPDVFFISCSDSRVDPNLITQSKPGELFVLRNAGNIIPPYRAQAEGGEAATLEYAIAVLKVKDIIICGHSDCGAVKGLLNPKAVEHLSMVSRWLQYGETTRRIVSDTYGDLKEEELLEKAVEVNVLVQLDHLRTHPFVASGLARGTLRLHGWVFDILHGHVLAFDSSAGRFTVLGDADAMDKILHPVHRDLHSHPLPR